MPKKASADRSLASLFFAHTGKGIDKWEQYLGMYEHELHPLLAAGKPLRLLEVGVQNGGSLELWADYLPAGSEIVGIDIDPNVAALTFGDRRIRVEVADATSVEQLRKALGHTTFDVIIDDGSHRCADVRATFDILFDHLANGGLYVIEDLHCSYYSIYGGGLEDDRSSIEYLKRIIDAVNYDHISSDSVEQSARADMARLNSQISRIAFYDSVAVVKKLDIEKKTPYRRLMSGVETPVQPFKNWVAASSPSQLQTIVFGVKTANAFELAFLEQIENERQRSAGFRARQAEKTKRIAKSLARKRTAIVKSLEKVRSGKTASGSPQPNEANAAAVMMEHERCIEALLKAVRTAETALNASRNET